MGHRTKHTRQVERNLIRLRRKEVRNDFLEKMGNFECKVALILILHKIVRLFEVSCS